MSEEYTPVGCMPRLPLTLSDFLLARIAEDEAGARAAFMDWQQVTATWEVVARAGKGATQVRTAANSYGTTYSIARTNEPAAAHIARHDPARVLADCEGRRRIVESIAPHVMHKDAADRAGVRVMQDDRDLLSRPILRDLARAYVHHPDFRDEWR